MSLSVNELEEEFNNYNIDTVQDKYDSEVLEEYDRKVSGYKCELKLFRVEDFFVFFENNPTKRKTEIYTDKDDAESMYMRRLDIYESRRDSHDIFFG